MKVAARKRMNVIAAAIAWWHAKGPIVYSHEEHLANAAINTTSDWEHELALAVGELLKAEPKLRYAMPRGPKTP